MANPEHVRLAREGSTAILRYQRANPDRAFDLSGVDLRFVDLFDAYLSFSNLSDANLTDAYLSGAKLINATLTRAILTRANLTDANLGGADLSGANLGYAVLVGLALDGADVFDAKFESTTLADADLSGVLNLHGASHQACTDVSVNTLINTLRGSPDGDFTVEQRIFLEACGLPKVLLDYLPGIFKTSPLEFYKVFISYGSDDQIFAERLRKDLISRGVQCWKFDHDAVGGRKVWANIDTAIKHFDKMVVVCSQHSLGRGAVQREIERALQKEDRLKAQNAFDPDVLFPIAIDNYVFSGWEHERKDDVLSITVVDFTKDYDTALGRLVEALTKGSRPPFRP